MTAVQMFFDTEAKQGTEWSSDEEQKDEQEEKMEEEEDAGSLDEFVTDGESSDGERPDEVDARFRLLDPVKRQLIWTDAEDDTHQENRGRRKEKDSAEKRESRSRSTSWSETRRVDRCAKSHEKKKKSKRSDTDTQHARPQPPAPSGRKRNRGGKVNWLTRAGDLCLMNGLALPEAVSWDCFPGARDEEKRRALEEHIIRRLRDEVIVNAMAIISRELNSGNWKKAWAKIKETVMLGEAKVDRIVKECVAQQYDVLPYKEQVTGTYTLFQNALQTAWEENKENIGGARNVKTTLDMSSLHQRAECKRQKLMKTTPVVGTAEERTRLKVKRDPIVPTKKNQQQRQHQDQDMVEVPDAPPAEQLDMKICSMLHKMEDSVHTD